jgi:hypothetical protein
MRTRHPETRRVSLVNGLTVVSLFHHSGPGEGIRTEGMS